MNRVLAALTLPVYLLMTDAVSAQMTTDDLKWVNQCLSDNADAKVSRAVVRAYCVCMNNKMSSNETRSISQWEKANPQARAACDRESGWR